MKITQPATKEAKKEDVKKEEEDSSSWQKMLHGIVRPPRSTIRDPLKSN